MIETGNGTNSVRKNQPNSCPSGGVSATESSHGRTNPSLVTPPITCAAEYSLPLLAQRVSDLIERWFRQSVLYLAAIGQYKFNPVSDLWPKQFIISDTLQPALLPIYIPSEASESVRERFRAVQRKNAGAFQLAHEIYLLENSAGITKRQKIIWRRQIAVTLNPVLGLIGGDSIDQRAWPSKSWPMARRACPYVNIKIRRRDD